MWEPRPFIRRCSRDHSRKRFISAVENGPPVTQFHLGEVGQAGCNCPELDRHAGPVMLSKFHSPIGISPDARNNSRHCVLRYLQRYRRDNGNH